jgi:hypothetical protein
MYGLTTRYIESFTAFLDVLMESKHEFRST